MYSVVMKNNINKEIFKQTLDSHAKAKAVLAHWQKLGKFKGQIISVIIVTEV